MEFVVKDYISLLCNAENSTNQRAAKKQQLISSAHLVKLSRDASHPQNTYIYICIFFSIPKIYSFYKHNQQL